MKKITIFLLALTIVFGLSGCEKPTEVEVTDREGNVVTIPTEINKIVSTAPSNTEVLIALGLADKIVAVDKYSPTSELSEDVAIINFREPDIELILSLMPDIVVASGHNKVGDEDPFYQLKEAGIAVVYIPSATSLDGILEDITFIGEVTNEESKAKEMVEDLQAEFDAIAAIAQTITEQKDVYFEIGDYSGVLYTFGQNTFLDDILTLIGANNLYHSEESWISVSAEDIIAKNPDVIITNQDWNPDAIANIEGRSGFETIDAVMNDMVYVVSGNYTSRGSQNIIEGIKQIAEAIYPDFYDFE